MDYNWENGQNPEDIGKHRLGAMRKFLKDFPRTGVGKRYVTDELPNLSFAEDLFDVALCSHVLFLYNDLLTVSFHINSAKEMLRVANEICIFPLLTLSGKPSHPVKQVINFCEKQGYQVERVKVDYEFQKGANEMLRIKHA